VENRNQTHAQSKGPNLRCSARSRIRRRAAPQRPINPYRRSKLAGEQTIGPTFAISFFLSSFTISWRDRILTSFLSNLRSFLIKKNSYSRPHLQKQIDVQRVSADQDGPALGGH
jgi:hypothetical protein